MVVVHLMRAALTPPLQAIRREAPRIGGSFAVWGGLFSTFDCTLVALRRKEDPWNSIAAGALTGGQRRMQLGGAAGGCMLGVLPVLRQATAGMCLWIS